MIHGLIASVFSSNLRGIRGRFSGTLESLRSRRLPRNCVALGIGDGDHRVIERRVDMRNARCNVFPLSTADTGIRFNHDRSLFRCFFLASDSFCRTFTSARVRMGALPANRKTATMTEPTVAAEVH